MKKKILVIDDEENLRKLLKRILDAAGYETVPAGGGAEAIAALGECPVDLIMLDMNMPEMDGLQFLSLLREKNLSRSPVLMISGETDTEVIVKCYRLGVYDFIKKPEKTEVMLKRVENGLKIGEMITFNDYIKTELFMAQRLQKYIFPEPEYDDGRFSISAWSRPLSDIGGDLWDYIRFRDGRFVFFVGDVSGHSISAALYTTMVSMVFRNAIQSTDVPGEILSYMNREISGAMPVEAFLTMVCGIVDPRDGVLRYANAGHPRPILFSGGAWVELPGSSAFLNQLSDSRFETYSASIAPGDSVLAFTDGILDITDDSGVMAGQDKLKELLNTRQSAPAVFDGIRETVAGGAYRINDDCTVMLVTLK